KRPDSSRMPSEPRRLLPRGGVREPNGTVVTAGGDEPAIGTVGNHAYRIGVSLQRGDFFAVCKVPDAHGMIPARRCQPLTVGTEGHAEHIYRVSFQGPDFLARVQVPDSNRLIAARTGYAPPVAPQAAPPHPTPLPPH